MVGIACLQHLFCCLWLQQVEEGLPQFASDAISSETRGGREGRGRGRRKEERERERRGGEEVRGGRKGGRKGGEGGSEREREKEERARGKEWRREVQ